MGFDAARALAQKGFEVYGAARRVALMDPLKEYGVIPLQLDVTSEESIDACLAATGPLDILVNCAGYGSFGAIENVSLEDIIVDHNLPFEDKVIHDLDLEVLHHALDSLNEEEYHIIDCLYLADSPMTEIDLAKSMGKSQRYINRLKRKIFDKIRKFF